jgi:hypothetical protein
MPCHIRHVVKPIEINRLSTAQTCHAADIDSYSLAQCHSQQSSSKKTQVTAGANAAAGCCLNVVQMDANPDQTSTETSKQSTPVILVQQVYKTAQRLSHHHTTC